MDIATTAPQLYRAMRALTRAIAESALDSTIGELVKIRASQLNGCAYCVDMHVTDARAAGETEPRLAAVAVWQEAPCFEPRERAALALTEELTRRSSQLALEAARDEATERFDEAEYAALVYAIGCINSWNAICVGAAAVPRSFEDAVS